MFGEPLYRQLVINLAALGVTPNVGAVLASILMHESNDGKSNVAKSCNNYGGIIYVGQAGASPCSRYQPGVEGGRQYAAYATQKDFLKDFLRIMRLNRSGRGAPLSALKRVELLLVDTGRPYTVDMLDVPEMVARMKANGYFQDSEQKYLAAVQNKFNQYAAGSLKKAYEGELAARMDKAQGKRYNPDVSFTDALRDAWTKDVVNPVSEQFGKAGKVVLWTAAGLAALILLTRR